MGDTRIQNDNGRVTITTGKQVTTFCDTGSAAVQVGLLHEVIEQQQADHAEEVAEFNAGWQAAMDSLPPDEPANTKHDVWLAGYAWAKWLEHEEAAKGGENDGL